MTSRLEEGVKKSPIGGVRKDLHTDRLMRELQNLGAAMGTRAVTSLMGKVEGTAGRLTDYTEKGGGLLSAVTGKAGKGGPGLLSTLAGAAGLGGGDGGSALRDRLAPGFNALKAFAKTKLEQKVKKGGGGRGKKLKVTNIVETVDVGVPLRLAYDQWTRFGDFPSFMKKVENVEQESDEKLKWKAQVFWSHRTWESTILEQVPDKRIVWRSKGAKGYVDGAVTFHELAPELTRIVLVLEYHPQGLFERTGNIWRAQGRRVRLELKHFRRHVMTQAVLRPEEIEGWRGEIHDGEVVTDQETALREEREAEGRPERERVRAGRVEAGERERPEYEGAQAEYEEEEYGLGEEELERETRQRPGVRPEEEGERYEAEYEEYEEEPGGRYEEEEEEEPGRRPRDRRGRWSEERPERPPERVRPRGSKARRY